MAAAKLENAIRPTIWLDEPGALNRALTQIQDPAVRLHVANVIQDGYTVLRDLPTAHFCDRVVEDYYRYCKEVHAEGRDKKSRIVNFHIYSERARALLMDAQLMQVLDALFGYESVLWTSLTFEYGTEQRLHRDSPHFDTRPHGYYFGVWTPLEDVSPESGPLQFVPGGHRIPCSFDVRKMTAEYLRKKDPAAPVNFDHLLETFFSDMDQQCGKAGLKPRSVDLKKGEKLIWHHWMPHGGSPVIKPELTRRSIVGHYIPMHVPVYHADVFFGVAEAHPTSYNYESFADRKYVTWPRADFQYSYL